MAQLQISNLYDILDQGAPNNFSSELSDVASAANIASIHAANGSGTIDGSSISSFTGTASALKTSLAHLQVPRQVTHRFLLHMTMLLLKLPISLHLKTLNIYQLLLVQQLPQLMDLLLKLKRHLRL